MKRKRGQIKLNPNDLYPDNTMDNSDVDEFYDYDDSVMEVDTPSSNGNTELVVNPDGAIDQTVGKLGTRVKVKLKKTKNLEYQSDGQTQSDTDKSSQREGLEQSGIKDDSANSDGKAGVSENLPKKVSSIKIKAVSNQTAVSQVEIARKKEALMNFREPQYNKKELDAALEVIMKIMKMDAAEPFNVPVNPVALGIPDYFDIIDTPMDFGTVRSNLENGVKYMNSEDVYKDVKYIWDNCIKYNSKGDYIMDLMKRVRKNFMKYWTSAGLYSDESWGVEDCFQADNIELSGVDKIHAKDDYIKQKAPKRGGKNHKPDCICAICVLVRRRMEREENERLARVQAGVSDSNLAEDLKLEESSPVNSPYGADSSSNMYESVDPHADDEGQVKEDMSVTEQQEMPIENKLDDVELKNGIENPDKDGCEILKVTLHNDRSRERSNPQNQSRLSDRSGTDVHIFKGATNLQHVDGSASVQLQKQEDIKKRRQKEKVLERLRYQNPTILSLCGALFPANSKSVWAAPHSLAGRYGSARKSSIHEAIESFFNLITTEEVGVGEQQYVFMNVGEARRDPGHIPEHGFRQ